MHTVKKALLLRAGEGHEEAVKSTKRLLNAVRCEAPPRLTVESVEDQGVEFGLSHPVSSRFSGNMRIDLDSRLSLSIQDEKRER
jgi:hypothetical protein